MALNQRDMVCFRCKHRAHTFPFSKAGMTYVPALSREAGTQIPAKSKAHSCFKNHHVLFANPHLCHLKPEFKTQWLSDPPRVRGARIKCFPSPWSYHRNSEAQNGKVMPGYHT